MTTVDKDPTATCSLRLLGAFALSVDGQQVQVTSLKGQILLARLAVERSNSMSRQQLSTFLWPDHGSAQARASLRQALSRLRDSLGSAASLLHSDLTNVWLDKPLLETDIDYLSPDLKISRLCSLGEFLDGLHLSELALQEWIETERRSYSEKLTSIITKRSDAAMQSGKYEDAIRLTLRQITLDPLSEAAHRRLMQAFSSSRRSSRAIQQYRTLQSLLRSELDVAPEKETTELYNNIRGQRASAPLQNPESSDLGQVEAAVETFPELRLMTVLCVRLVSNQTESEDIEDMVRDSGGEKLQSSGDDACFLFGLNATREDDTLRALKAASKIVEHYSDKAIGMAAGLLTKEAQSVEGEALRRAQMLGFLAAPGEILSASALRNQASAWATFNEEDVRGQKFWRVISVNDGSLRPRPKFVGRKLEFLQLSLLQDEAANGNGSVVILSGNAGMGKTRTAEELEARARSMHALVLRSEFTPAAENRESYLFRIATQLAAVLQVRSVNDLPSFEAKPNEFALALFANQQSGEPVRQMSGIGQSVLMDMATQTISRMFDRVPAAGLTLVFEDCHWASLEEIEFLAHLFRHVHAHRVFIVATERASEEKLRLALQSQSMETPLHITMLSPLRASEAQALARDVIGEATDDEARIVDHAAGNPLFTIRLAEARNDLGDTIPTSVIALAQLQLDQLEERSKRYCQDAAVLGRRFPRTDALNIFGPDFTSGVLANGFLNARGPDFEFDHALIRQGIYEATPVRQRQAAHTAAAAYYRTRDAFKWAEHAVSSGDDDLATKASIAAANEAVTQNRFAVAERLVLTGLSAGCTGNNKAELQRSLADIRRDQGQFDEAIELYREASKTAEDASLRLRSLVGQAWMLRYRGATDEAAAVFAHAQTLTETHDVSSLSHCDFLAELGNRAFMTGDANAAFAAHSKGLQLSRNNGHAEQIARALGGLGDAHYASFKLTSAQQCYSECIEFAENNNLGMVANAHRHMLSYTSFFVNPSEQAMALNELAISRAISEGNVRNEFTARIDVLDYLALNRDFKGFDAQLIEINALLERMGGNRFESDLDGARCTRALMLGDLDTLHEISSHYIKQPPSPYNWPAFAALHACSLKDIKKRLSWLEKGEALFEHSSISHAIIFFYHFASEAMRDQPESALAFAKKLEQRSGDEFTGFARLSVRTTQLRAQSNPDRILVDALRKDLVDARLTGFWTQLFSDI